MILDAVMADVDYLKAQLAIALAALHQYQYQAGLDAYLRGTDAVVRLTTWLARKRMEDLNLANVPGYTPES